MSRERLIDKVAALLAKAASTDHEPERRAFQAKAQTLITRYQIEEEELEVRPVAIREQIVEVEGWGNATRGVVHLYSAIAELNRCKVAHQSARGRSTVLLYGTETDASLTCALVEHLLPQLRLAILNDRPRSRMSYSVGWAYEVAKRLAEAREVEAAASSSLVPTNTEADEALRAAYKITNGRRTTIDVAGYGSGMEAAERADIGRIKVGPRDTPDLGA